MSPNETKAEVVGKIVYLRQSYHFGPHKIAMYLKRYHDVQISPSGIWRILKRLDMSRLPSSQRYRKRVDRLKRYEKPLPGHRVQIDVKFIAPLQAPARSTTSSPRSTTAPGSGSSDSTTASTRRSRSSSSTTCSRSSPSRSR